MKKLLALLSFLSISVIALAQSPDYKPDNAYQLKSFNSKNLRNLDVRTSGGHITVKGGSKSFDVEAYVRRKSKFVSKGEDIGPWIIEMNEKGATLEIIAKSTKSFRNNDISISFIVYVPDEINSELSTSGGHITVSDLQGDQNLRTSGGHIKLTNVRGTLDGRTSGGHLDLVDCQGKIELRTSGGHITMNNTAGVIDARTSGGHIKLDNVSGELSAETSGGNINATLGNIQKSVVLETSGGNISVEMPSDDYDLDIEGSHVNAKVENFEGTKESDFMRGRIGKGGTRVRLRTSGGMVNIRFD